MAWSNLSGSQMVSFTDAQTSGFALKEGQSHATSLQCMTKSEILSKYTLDIGTTYGNPYADNQLVPVVDWIPKGTGYCPSLTDLSSITSNFVGYQGNGTWYFTFTYIGTLTTTATLWYRTRRDGVYTPNQFYPPLKYTATFSPGSTHTLTGGSTQIPATYLEFETFECSETIIAPYVYYVNYDTEQGTTAGYATACAFGPATYPVYTNASSLSGIGSGTVIYQDPYGYPYYSGGVTRWLAIGATEDGAVTRALELNINAVVQQNVDCSTPPPVYYNTQQSGTATRDNCSAEYTGGSATLTVSANTYSSSTSIEDANNQAIAYIDANKQAYANANGTCNAICTSYTHVASRDSTIYWTSCNGTPSSRSTSRFGSYTICALTGTNTGGAGSWFDNGMCNTSTVYYNTEQSGTATRNNCPEGYTAGSATLTVAANSFSSIISVADANNQAIAYINANKQDYANDNATCTAPVYYNTQQSGTATRNNCSVGYTGSTETLIVQAGTYTSSISVQNANDLAIAYIELNAQNYANTNGTCTSNTPTAGFIYNFSYTDFIDDSQCILEYTFEGDTTTILMNETIPDYTQNISGTIDIPVGAEIFVYIWGHTPLTGPADLVFTDITAQYNVGGANVITPVHTNALVSSFASVTFTMPNAVVGMNATTNAG